MKKGNKKALKLGIMPKILAISIGCLLAALITAQAVTKNIASDKFVDNAKMNLSKLAEQKGDSIERFIESQKLLTHSVAIDGNIVTACQKYKTTGDINLPLQNKISAFLGDIQTQSGNLYENFFMTVENVGFADCLNNQTLHDVKEEPFYKECMKNGYFFGNNISPVTGNPVYVIAYAIQDPETGKYIGTVNNSIDLYTMTKIDVDDEEYDVKICTKEGQVIAAANPDDILNMDMSQINPEGWQQTLQSENGIADYYVPETGESGYVGYYVTDNFVTEVGILDKAFDGARADMTAAAVTITIIASVLSVVLIVLGCLTIVNPLKEVNKKIKSMVADINAGKGDLTTRVSVGTHDEVREMAESINMLLETFQGVMTMLNDASEKLEASSAAVRESIQVAEDQVSNVSSTMEEMAASSQETSASINMVVEKMTNINELVNTVYSQAIESSGESQKIVESVESLREAAFKERDESDAQTKIIIEALHKSMEAAKEVDRITELTEDILNIASETNLLSLNASIEAARAGEAGKGFAVVAQEISKLASNSTESANNIQSISEAVIGSVNDLAKKAEEIAETLLGVNQSGRETVEKITASYQNDIKSLAEEMDAFANKSSSVQSEIEDIKESIDHINGAVEENALGVTDVTTSAVEIAGNIANIAEEATSNLDVSKKIGEEVLKFKI